MLCVSAIERDDIERDPIERGDNERDDNERDNERDIERVRSLVLMLLYKKVVFIVMYFNPGFRVF